MIDDSSSVSFNSRAAENIPSISLEKKQEKKHLKKTKTSEKQNIRRNFDFENCNLHFFVTKDCKYCTIVAYSVQNALCCIMVKQ